MKTVIYYHVLMVNHWQQVLSEQMNLIISSGLYAYCDQIKIGCLGSDLKQLKYLTSELSKVSICYHIQNEKEYEFPTLNLLWEDAKKEKPFYALYLHTKGVSFLNHPGGKYWRDFMMHYNVSEYKECVKRLRKGYDTCGCKLWTSDCIPKYSLHYSGNFFWAKSTYIKKLKEPVWNQDRYQAEFWSCTGNPNAATLSQLMVDYNCKGTFQVMKKTSGKNYVHTLAYNLPSETAKTVDLLYKQNDTKDFKHYIVDLGFPVVADDEKIPIQEAKRINSESLKKIARTYGSVYIKMENIGVSQNWTQIYKHIGIKDDDMLIGADPDERTLTNGWIMAMGDVLRSGNKISLVSLMMTAHKMLINDRNSHLRTIDGHTCIYMKSGINWALIGILGKLLNEMNGIPVPTIADRYGYIESAVREHMTKLGHEWVILRDYEVRHTDYELGDPGTSSIYREWKNYVIFTQKRGEKQISFDNYLIKIKKI